MRVDHKIDDGGVHRLAEPKADGHTSSTQVEHTPPAAWPWSEYKAELLPTGNSRRKRKNSHPAYISTTRRTQLPLMPKQTDWIGITSAGLAVCAFAALGALELHFRSEPAQAPPVAKESKTEPSTLMQGDPADGSSSAAPAERKENAPISSAVPALEGAPPVPGASKAEVAAPEAIPSKPSLKQSHGRKRHKKRAGNDLHQ